MCDEIVLCICSTWPILCPFVFSLFTYMKGKNNSMYTMATWLGIHIIYMYSLVPSLSVPQILSLYSMIKMRRGKAWVQGYIIYIIIICMVYFSTLEGEAWEVSGNDARCTLVLYLITMVMCCTCASSFLIYIVYDCPVSQLLLPNTRRMINFDLSEPKLSQP